MLGGQRIRARTEKGCMLLALFSVASSTDGLRAPPSCTQGGQTTQILWIHRVVSVALCMGSAVA